MEKQQTALPRTAPDRVRQKKSKLRYITPPVLQLYTVGVLTVGYFLDIDPVAQGGGTSFLPVLILELMAFVLPAIFFVKLQPPSYYKRMHLRLFGAEKAVFVLFVSGFTVCALTVLKLLLQTVAGYLPNTRVLWGIPTPTIGFDPLDSAYTILIFALIPAVVQCFYYRSVVFAYYEKYGKVTAVVCSAFLFALTQFSAGDALVHFLYGLILAFAVCVTDSVFGAMIVHFVYCLYQIGLERYIWSFVGKPDGMVFFVFVSVALLLLFGALLAGEAERIALAAGEDELPEQSSAPQNRQSGWRVLVSRFVHPAMLICIAVYAAASFLIQL